MKSCLIVVDIQKDFLPGGALGVKGGDKIVPKINALIHQFDHCVACIDWHPKNHCSFATTHHKKVGERVKVGDLEQILWPVHCVQNTPGAAFADELDTSTFEQVFHKGSDPDIDSYGAFFDNGHKRDTGLHAYLQDLEVGHLFVAGLTTEYCVKYTALQARQLGYKVSVILDACKPVELSPGDESRALEEMKGAGATLMSTLEFPVER
ncbi:MAG: bifunctional nicotinamidase/pyrazinamidase [Parachlamydiales bacterium]